MLGTEINESLYSLIGKRVTINDPRGPIEAEVVDIANGLVFYGRTTGEKESMPIDEFKKRCKEF